MGADGTDICGPETVRVTGTVSGLFEAELDEIVIVPLYEPALSPVGFTETLTDRVVLPELGETLNHPPPLLVVAAAEKGIEAVLDTCIDCIAGAAAPRM